MQHPIENLMRTAMESIRAMVDVNTVIGDPVETKDGTVIVPISRVSFGFAAGGGEYGVSARGRGAAAAGDGAEPAARDLPFAGGSGAGVSVAPVGFLVVGPHDVRLLPVTDRAIYDRLIDVASDLIERFTRGPEEDASDGLYDGDDYDGDDDDVLDDDLELQDDDR